MIRKVFSWISGIALSFVPSAYIFSKNEDEEEESKVIEKILAQRHSSTAKGISERLRAKQAELAKAPVDLKEIMQPVRSMTQLESVDGLSARLTLEPSKNFRMSTAWNFSNISQSSFQLCSGLTSDNEDDENIHGNHLLAEYNSSEGVNAYGKYTFLKNFPIAVIGEAKILPNEIGFTRSLKENEGKPRMSNISIEIRKIFESLQAGVFARSDSFGVLLLKRFNSQFTTGVELEFENFQLRQPNGRAGIRYENKEHKLCGEYHGRDNKLLSMGYAYDHSSNKIGLGVEHLHYLVTGESDTRFGIRARFMEGEVKANLNTKLRASSEISHVIKSMILIRLYGQADLIEDHPPVFGISLDVGSLSL